MHRRHLMSLSLVLASPRLAPVLQLMQAPDTFVRLNFSIGLLVNYPIDAVVSSGHPTCQLPVLVDRPHGIALLTFRNANTGALIGKMVTQFSFVPRHILTHSTFDIRVSTSARIDAIFSSIIAALGGVVTGFGKFTPSWCFLTDGTRGIAAFLNQSTITCTLMQGTVGDWRILLLIGGSIVESALLLARYPDPVVLGIYPTSVQSYAPSIITISGSSLGSCELVIGNSTLEISVTLASPQLVPHIIACKVTHLLESATAGSSLSPATELAYLPQQPAHGAAVAGRHLHPQEPEADGQRGNVRIHSGRRVRWRRRHGAAISHDNTRVSIFELSRYARRAPALFPRLHSHLHQPYGAQTRKLRD